MRAVNATVGSLLGFLHDGPQSGWDLVATAQHRIGDFWSLTRSQVYRELTGMADDGLITVQETGPRERRAYALTDLGREAFRDWISRPPGEEQIRYPLLLTLAFADHLPPERLAAHLADHRAIHQARLDDYRRQHGQAVAAGARARDLITLDFGERYEAAVLGWFDALPDPVAPDRPTTGGR
ncbi:PadR family transcriptional regulator [Nakamurella flavida]|uniref:PadR family transcriptional regulator n=1 Tax=Nakamurella flavida TaxID=363630 RepID=A0A938YIL5_9ACTN|nr:helix-turn-helix transcriptional regulator [Nakamurella flavida]MBM9475969.1 PadR family transcriptional regulator [Nakamurella flavida]MBM9478371.1 PadR family transcriptional regulator [Nakamurella flavida]MDP9777742.1 DNA-binding PadR family transcriptional regulator [Nakamurella flavida]